jgi:hypothetical protein
MWHREWQGHIGFAGSGLLFSQLTHPVNILLLGTSVLPPDIQKSSSRNKKSERMFEKLIVA